MWAVWRRVDREYAAVLRAPEEHLGQSANNSTCPDIERGTSLAVRCAMLAFDIPAITGAMVLIGMHTGMGLRPAVIMAMGVGVLVGLMIAWSMIIAPTRKLARDRTKLISRISKVTQVDREEHLDGLLAIEEGHELAPLSRAVHDALTLSHRDRLAALRMRREMDTRVRDTTRKKTAQLSKLSETDELTGMLNRRGLGARSGETFTQSVERRLELSVIAIDLDKFKQLNDTCGHAAGDKALKALGELICAQVRARDIAARLGGDEFVILMLGTPATSAMHVANRLLRMYAAHPAGQNLPWPGISAGVASRIEHKAETLDGLKHMADEALYVAKRNGRGNVTVWSDEDAASGRTAA